ncbi:MAG: hypothetical protein R6X02_13025 [Enhygromyxa sp.]
MQLLTPTPEQGALGLRALWTLATVDGPISPEERSVLEAARSFVGADRDLAELDAIEPDELAAAFPEDPQLRWQLCCALALMSMVDEKPTREESALLEAFARALGVDNDMVATVHKLAHDHLWLARFDIYRRFWGREHLLAKIEREGWSGFTETVRALRRKQENPELTARYRALAELPEGTLGRSYFEFISTNQFSFPGELGHGPELIVQHDLAHVLGGYGADSREELAIGFFSAGFRRQDPMTFVLLTMFQLHLGIATMPGQPVDTGSLDMRVCMEALRRGAAMSFDLSGDWDYWADMDKPVAELRERYGIMPRIE